MFITKAEQARQLRRKHKNIKEIAFLLQISQSTARKYLSKKHAIAGSCTIKIRYKTAEDAQAIITRDNRNCHTYHCPHCNGYHLGSRKPKKETTK